MRETAYKNHSTSSGMSAADRIRNKKQKKKSIFPKKKDRERIVAVVEDKRPQNNIIEKKKKPAAFKNELTEEYLEEKAAEEEERLEKSVRVGAVTAKIVKIVMLASCIYLIFLIYGVLMTDFIYDSQGNVIPQVLDVEEIEEKKKFQLILAQYEKCRMLYENTLMIDYRLGQGIEDPLQLATEYEKLIKDPSNVNNMENLYQKTRAMVIDTRYTQVRELMMAWLDDEGNYLGSMSSAITNNDTSEQEAALFYRDEAYNKFYMLTQNIVSLGNGISGVDMHDVEEWSPDGYLDKAINGAN